MHFTKAIGACPNTLLTRLTVMRVLTTEQHVITELCNQSFEFGQGACFVPLQGILRFWLSDNCEGESGQLFTVICRAPADSRAVDARGVYLFYKAKRKQRLRERF